MTAVDGSTSYTQQDLVATLTSIMNGFQPATIRTQDFVDTFGDGDHSDHYATALFTQAANNAYTSVSHELVGYMGYPISNLVADVSGNNETAKINTFFIYAPYDAAVPQTLAQANADNYGLWFARQYAVATVVDNIPPSTTVRIPSNGAALSGTNAALDASASTAAGVATVQFVLSGGAYTQSVIGTAVATPYGYILEWDTTSVPNGTYTLQSLATDKLGNTAYSAGITVIVGNGPSTTVLIPSNGATLSGTKAVLDASASATAGVATVQFALSGGTYTQSVIGTAVATPYGYILEWDTTSVPNGTYTLQSLATDKLGNTAYSAAITVIVDNSPPSTTVLIPSNGATLSGTKAVLDASASAAAGVATVQFALSGGTYTQSVIGTAVATPYGYILEWDTTSVPNGTYTLQSLATDKLGNTAYSAAITVIVDNSPPSTTVLVPSNGATLSGTKAVLDASATAGVATVQFVLSGGAYTQSVIGTAVSTPYGYVFEWDTTSVPNGTYTLQSVASYNGGESGTSPGITIIVSN